ncbi:MAG: hemerythrin domain-containing protein [Methanosarcina sp.]
MDTIYDILSKEHQILIGMFNEAMITGSKEALFRIKAEIDPHMAGEEKFFYPRLEEKEESEGIAHKANIEHNEAKALMIEMEGMQEGDENWAIMLKELKDVIMHHINEENEVFKVFSRVLSREETEEIAQKYLEFKRNYTAKMETGQSLA